MNRKKKFVFDINLHFHRLMVPSFQNVCNSDRHLQPTKKKQLHLKANSQGFIFCTHLRIEFYPLVPKIFVICNHFYFSSFKKEFFFGNNLTYRKVQKGQRTPVYNVYLDLLRLTFYSHLFYHLSEHTLSVYVYIFY